MTSTGETKSERGILSALSASLVIRLTFLLAVGLLVLGLALYGLAAAKLVWPDLLASSAETTYGRVLPAGTNLLVFGFLTVAFLGIAFHLVPRLAGASLFFPLAALGVVGLVAGGAVVGSGLILLGHNAGGYWLEYPLLIDGAMIAATFGAASLLTITARNGDREHLPIGAWWFVAGAWWLFLSTLAGAAPLFDGLAAELQSAFTGATLLGLWVVPAAIGTAYAVVAGSLDDAQFHPRLGRIGFWSLTLTWAWSATRVLQYGPTNDWLETIPVLFLAGLVVAGLTIAADFAHALRGRWSEVASRPLVKMTVGSIGFLVIVPPLAFVASLRSASAVVHFTRWESGIEIAVLFGVGLLSATAGILHVIERQGGRAIGPMLGRLLLWPMALGVTVAVLANLVAGLRQGYAWLAGVESTTYSNFGDGFVESVGSLDRVLLVSFMGVALVAVGSLLFGLVALLGLLTRWAPADSEERAPSDIVLPVSRLMRNAVLLFVAAALGVFLLPATEVDVEPSLLADATRQFDEGSLWAQGRDVYISEGCWYCHTQQVRQVVTDVGLGPVSVPGDYAHDPVGLAGRDRLGPDLFHVGGRPDTDSAAFIASHLAGPDELRPWTIMPSYRYLSSAELTALSAYLAGLK